MCDQCDMEKAYMVKVFLHENDERWCPVRAHNTDAAYDLSSRDDIIVEPKKPTLVRTGVYLGLTPGWMAEIRPRSGLALKHSITVLNTPGTIDSGYRGEVGVILYNAGPVGFRVRPHDRIAQMVIQRVPNTYLGVARVENMDSTERADGGFGSTGVSRATMPPAPPAPPPTNVMKESDARPRNQ